VAVGVTVMDSNQASRGSRGKVLRIIHVFLDQLWAAGNRWIPTGLSKDGVVPPVQVDIPLASGASIATETDWDSLASEFELTNITELDNGVPTERKDDTTTTTPADDTKRAALTPGGGSNSSDNGGNDTFTSARDAPSHRETSFQRKARLAAEKAEKERQDAARGVFARKSKKEKLAANGKVVASSNDSKRQQQQATTTTTTTGKESKEVLIGGMRPAGLMGAGLLAAMSATDESSNKKGGQRPKREKKKVVEDDNDDITSNENNNNVETKENDSVGDNTVIDNETKETADTNEGDAASTNDGGEGDEKDDGNDGDDTNSREEMTLLLERCFLIALKVK
jgi:hypothetical protein